MNDHILAPSVVTTTKAATETVVFSYHQITTTTAVF